MLRPRPASIAAFTGSGDKKQPVSWCGASGARVTAGYQSTGTAGIQNRLVRPLLVLLIVVLAAAASGVPSTIAATASGDDCCADGAVEVQSGEVQSEERPSGERDECPPLCHACACSPAFALPTVTTTDTVLRAFGRHVPVGISSQLPAGPPGPGVFHPPRASA